MTSLAVTLCVSGISSIMWVTYYTHHPLWVEHAAYGMWSNVLFEDALAKEGYWGALRTSLNGSRHALQPAVLALISPRLLWWPHSHLLMAAGSLYLFLDLLARFVRRRTGSAWLAVAAPVLFGTLIGLYDERQGMGVPWPDYQSMFFLSSGLLSLGLYSLSRTGGWLALAGACASLAALARDTGAVWAIVTALPIVAVLLLQEFRRRDLSGAMRFALWFVIPALPAGLMLVQRLSFFQQYYMTSNAYQLRQPLGIAARSMGEQLLAFCGVLPLVAMGVLIAAALVASPRKKWTTEDFIVGYWPASFLVLLLANGYNASGVTKEVMYLAPGLICAVMTLGGGMDMRPRGARVLLVSTLAVCFLSTGAAVAQAYSRARYPDANAIALRDSQRALVAALVDIPRRVWWQSFSEYDWGTVTAALTFYESGRYQPTENRWFYNKKSYWDANFPNMSLSQLQAFILTQAEQHVELAIVLKDPDHLPAGMEDYSFLIASSVAKHIHADAQWQHYRDVDTSAFAPLALFYNLRKVAH
jgi:hypothetical protein